LDGGLGGVSCVDLLLDLDQPIVKGFVVGSQFIGYFVGKLEIFTKKIGFFS